MGSSEQKPMVFTMSKFVLDIPSNDQLWFEIRLNNRKLITLISGV